MAEIVRGRDAANATFGVSLGCSAYAENGTLLVNIAIVAGKFSLSALLGLRIAEVNGRTILNTTLNRVSQIEKLAEGSIKVR